MATRRQWALNWSSIPTYALFIVALREGVVIFDGPMRRMESVESREDQLAMGVRIARESVERVHHRVAGIQVNAPFGKVATALAVIEGWSGEW